MPAIVHSVAAPQVALEFEPNLASIVDQRLVDLADSADLLSMQEVPRYWLWRLGYVPPMSADAPIAVTFFRPVDRTPISERAGRPDPPERASLGLMLLRLQGALGPHTAVPTRGIEAISTAAAKAEGGVVDDFLNKAADIGRAGGAQINLSTLPITFTSGRIVPGAAPTPEAVLAWMIQRTADHILREIRAEHEDDPQLDQPANDRPR